jgi:hypothetical protein
MFENVNDTPDQNDLKGKKFIGTVVENNDPLMIERIKVSIPNMFQGPTAGLPWVGPNFHTTVTGSKSQYGSFGLIPLIGTQVVVIFQDGNPMYPMYEAFPIQTDERPAEAYTNYLYRYGHKDPRGNVFFIDTKPDANPQAYVKLACGVEITVSDTGKVNVTIADDVTQTMQKKLTVNVTGDVLINAQANLTASVQGTFTVQANGPANINSSTQVGINAPAIVSVAPNVSLQASGVVSITAPQVNIN